MKLHSQSKREIIGVLWKSSAQIVSSKAENFFCFNVHRFYTHFRSEISCFGNVCVSMQITCVVSKLSAACLLGYKFPPQKVTVKYSARCDNSLP